MVAASVGNREAITWLVQNGANIDAKDKSGLTAKDHAKKGNTLKTDRFFLEVVAAAKKRAP
jgi:ankyrin repeat protein